MAITPRDRSARAISAPVVLSAAVSPNVPRASSIRLRSRGAWSRAARATAASHGLGAEGDDRHHHHGEGEPVRLPAALQLQHRLCRATPAGHGTSSAATATLTSRPTMSDNAARRGSARVSGSSPAAMATAVSVTTVATLRCAGRPWARRRSSPAPRAAAAEIGAVSRLPGISTRRYSPPAMARKKATRSPHGGSAVPSAMCETTTIRLDSVSTSPRSPSSCSMSNRDGHFTHAAPSTSATDGPSRTAWLHAGHGV